jgi:hypothetical protein
MSVFDPVRLIGVYAEPLTAVRFVLGVIAVEENDVTLAFERKYMRGDAVEEPAVVTDDEHTADKIFQSFLKRAHCVDIEIIRGFIK